LEKFKTLKETCSARLNIRRSLFISYVSPVSNLEEVKTFLRENIRKDATHNCYAYRILKEGSVVEFSTDAGEPRGSAGLPILNVLRKRDLINVVALVVRYFGGKKLGVRGLIDAYSKVVEMSLKECQEIIMVKMKKYTVFLKYEDMGKEMERISKYRILDMRYEKDGVEIVFLAKAQENLPGDFEEVYVPQFD